MHSVRLFTSKSTTKQPTQFPGQIDFEVDLETRCKVKVKNVVGKVFDQSRRLPSRLQSWLPSQEVVSIVCN